MSEKNTKHVKPAVIEAAFALARLQGWENTSMTEIAAKAGVKLPDLYDYFDDRSAILSAYEHQVDKRVLALAEESGSKTGPARDRIFDILMDRFDILNEERDALCAILGSVPRDPKQAVIALPHLAQSLNRMMDAAGINTNGIKGAVKLAGLSTIYLKTLWVWTNDDSPDMAKTMAALDQNLDRAERWGGMLGILR